MDFKIVTNFVHQLIISLIQFYNAAKSEQRLVTIFDYDRPQVAHIFGRGGERAILSAPSWSFQNQMTKLIRNVLRPIRLGIGHW